METSRIIYKAIQKTFLQTFKDFGENMKNLSVSQQAGEVMFARMLQELWCTFFFQIRLLLFNSFSVSIESLYYDGYTFCRCRKTFFSFEDFYWSIGDLLIVDILRCIIFKCTAKWISYTYTYIHSFLDSVSIEAITEY